MGCFSFGNTEKEKLDVNLQLLLLNYVAQKIDSVMPSLLFSAKSVSCLTVQSVKGDFKSHLVVKFGLGN